MEDTLEKMYTNFSDRYSKVLEANERARKVYGELFNQRNTIKSKLLFDLLSSEIVAYNEMNNAFDKYMVAQVAYTKKYNDRIEQTLSMDATANIDQHEELFIHNNMLPINNSLDLYINAVSRATVDWATIRQMLLKLGIDITIGNIPVVSNIMALIDAAIQISDIVSAYTNGGTDYSDIDQELFGMEIHIDIMKNATMLFLYQAEVFGNASGNNTSKTE